MSTKWIEACRDARLVGLMLLEAIDRGAITPARGFCAILLYAAGLATAHGFSREEWMSLADAAWKDAEKVREATAQPLEPAPLFGAAAQTRGPAS